MSQDTHCCLRLTLGLDAGLLEWRVDILSLQFIEEKVPVCCPSNGSLAVILVLHSLPYQLFGRHFQEIEYEYSESLILFYIVFCENFVYR